MADTPNHNYNIPQKGAENWHTYLNENFQDIDADAVIKDTIENRPSSPPVDSWFLATDQQILYYYDGNEWLVVGGAGSDTDAVPGMTNLESLRVDEMYHVRDVSEAEKLLDAGTDWIRFEQNPTIEKTLTIDPGKWDVASRNIKIELPGKTTVTAGDRAIEVLSNSTQEFRGNVTIIGGEMEGPGGYSPSSGDDGIVIDEFTGANVQFSDIHGFENGILAIAGDNQCENLVVETKKIRGCNTPVHLDGSSGSEDSFKSTFLRCQALNPEDGAGLRLNQCALPASVIWMEAFLTSSDQTGVYADVVNNNGSLYSWNFDGTESSTATNVDLRTWGTNAAFHSIVFGNGGPKFNDPNDTHLIHKRSFTSSSFIGPKWYDRNTKLFSFTSGHKIRFGDNGAGIKLGNGGEILAVNEDGETTSLTSSK